ncbi:Os1348 family NHLP clan protein [Bradyrhizobium diazoefficiens]
MAAQDLQAIIKRAFVDDTFRLGLIKHFQQTIDGLNLDLTPEELQNLKRVNWDNLGAVAGGGGSWVHIYSTT